MMSRGWTGTYQNMPPMRISPLQEKLICRYSFGQDMAWGHYTHSLCESVYQEQLIELYNRGSKPFNWKATTQDNWIKLNRTTGKVNLQDRITVSVDWNKVPQGDDVVGVIELTSGNQTKGKYSFLSSIGKSTVEELKGMYVEDGCVSINAGKFHRKVENSGIKIRAIKGLGYENDCVQLGEATRMCPICGSLTKA